MNHWLVTALLFGACGPAQVDRPDTSSPSGPRYTALATHSNAWCALRDESELDCWGPPHGQRSAPIEHEDRPAPPWIDVALLPWAICVVNDVGALGCATSTGQAEFAERVRREGGVARIEARNGAMCALGHQGEVECWHIDLPEAFAGVTLEPMLDVAPYGQGGCGLTEDGRGVCFGELEPWLVPPSHDRSWVELEIGAGSACGIDAAGTLDCWGGSTRSPESDGIDQVAVEAGVACWRYVESGNTTCAVVNDRATEVGSRSPGLDGGPGRPALKTELGAELGCSIGADRSLGCWP